MLNLADLKTPGVYIDEVSKFPPSVAQVETAIPAFIGYTRNTTQNGESLIDRPIRIKSLIEYESVFGVRLETFTAEVDTNASDENIVSVFPEIPTDLYRMYYSLQIYFANGGGPCYIVSVGTDTEEVDLEALQGGLTEIGKEDEPTLLVFPDALELDRENFYNIYKAALAQCDDLKDRFTICDVFDGHLDYTDPGGDDVINDADDGFRTLIGNNFLMYGAAYYPHLVTSLNYNYDEEAVEITGTLNGDTVPSDMVLRLFDPDPSEDEEDNSLYHQANGLYHQIKDHIAAMSLVLPPSSTMAGVYATVDSRRGVWKAPANISLRQVSRPSVVIDDEAQQNLNIHTTGKAVNAIRTFTGKGVLVWGARTLDGNDNEWKYINVRRFFNMVEESTKKASEPFVFEPNDANTWVKVRGMIENFLTLQWRAGALAGAKPDQAFYVRVGLGQTMTPQDILEGRMIVEIGMAVVRPAEFIVLRFSHKMQES